MDTRAASWKVRNAANYLSMAIALGESSSGFKTCLQVAVEELTEAANALGYVLVRSRQPKSEADTSEVA